MTTTSRPVPCSSSLRVACLLTTLTFNLPAATLYWDGDGNVTLGQSDNTNTAAQDWLSDGLWDDGSTSQVLASWTSGDSAVFGGSAASQTITAGAFTVGDLVFGGAADGSSTSGTAYTLTGGDITLSDTTVTTNTDTIIQSVLSGSSSLTKAGDGTLSLTNRQTYTGGTIINAGTLDLAGGGGIAGTIRGTVTVNTGGTLRLSTGDATGYGTGSDRLSTINISGGTLHINTTSNQTLGNATVNLTGGTMTGVGGSNLDFFQGSSALNSFASATTSTISGVKLSIRQTGGLTINVEDGTAGTDLQVNSVIASHGGFTSAPLIKAGDGSMRLTSASTYSGATVVNGGTLWISNTLRNTSSLTVNSGAVLELGTVNMFVGGHGTALADSMVLTADGGTLLMNGSMDSRIGNVTLANGGTFTSNRGLGGWDVLLANTTAGSATVSVTGSGAATMNGTGGIHLQGVQNFAVADTTGNADPDLIVSMILANKGNAGGDDGGVLKTGTGTMILSNSNSYAGTTQVSEGTLIVGDGAGAGSIGSGNVSVADGATLIIDRGSFGQIWSNNFSGEGTLRIEAGQDPQFSGDNSGFTGPVIIDGANAQFRTRSANAWSGQSVVTITNGGMASAFSYINTNDIRIGSLWGDGTVRIGGADRDLYLGGNNLDGDFSGRIRNDAGGSGSVIKTGTGTQTLSGNNDYSGGTVINGGVLKLGTNTNPLGSGGVTINSGGTLDLNGYPAASNAGYGLGVTITGTGSTGQGALTNSGSATNSGMIQFPNITLAGNASIGGTGNFYMIASGYGPSSLDLAGHTLTKSGTNTYFLTNTTVTSGTIQIDEGKISQFRASDASAAAVSLADTSGAALELNNLALSVGSLAGGGATGGNVNLGSATLTVGALHSSTSYAGAITGTGSLVKTGTGTLTLAGANSYTGSTTVAAGTLVVDGSISTGSVSIDSPATLGGSGTIGGNTTIAGTHAPGNSPGIQTFTGDITYSSGSIFEWELDLAQTDPETNRGIAYDGVNVGGTLSGSSATFAISLTGTQDFTDNFWASSRTWTDIFTDDTDPINFASVFSGFSYSNDNGSLDPTAHGSFSLVNSSLSWSPIPEPGSALVGLLISAGLFHRRRAEEQGSKGRG